MRLKTLRIGEMIPGGGTWMGGTFLPVFTQFMILTDREDGTLWLLTHYVTEAGRDYFAITDEWNARKQPLVEYGPYDGPYLPNHPHLRFFIRGGRIGYEEIEGANQSQRILSRKLMQRHTLEVLVPTSFKRFGDELAFERINFG